MKTNEIELLQKSELLIDLRGYQEQSTRQSEEAIDIKVTNPVSDETVLMHIVTKSNLKSDAIGVEKVEEAEQILEEPDIDRLIMFGKRFTKAARRVLREEGIEFFSQKQRVLSTLNQQEVYSNILNCVDKLCQIKCGYIPQSETECKGYSSELINCSFCSGSGKAKQSTTSYREQRCPVCGGAGSKRKHYTCEVRLISDNADFHLERGWFSLLRNDLFSLLQILQNSNNFESSLNLTMEKLVEVPVEVIS